MSEEATVRPDAIELLMLDHRSVEELFTRFESASADVSTARDAAQELVKELSVHAAIEEQSCTRRCGAQPTPGSRWSSRASRSTKR